MVYLLVMLFSANYPKLESSTIAEKCQSWLVAFLTKKTRTLLQK